MNDQFCVRPTRTILKNENEWVYSQLKTFGAIFIPLSVKTNENDISHKTT